MSDDVVLYLTLEECVAVEIITAVTQWSSFEYVPSHLYHAVRGGGNGFKEIADVRKSIRARPTQQMMLGPMNSPTIGEKNE